MFNEQDKKMCELIFSDCNVILSHETGVCDGINCDWYVVLVDNCVYHMTKHNGEWVYLFYAGEYKGGV